MSGGTLLDYDSELLGPVVAKVQHNSSSLGIGEIAFTLGIDM